MRIAFGRRWRPLAVSLRVFLLMVLGIALGVGWQVHRARLQRQVVRVVAQYGGEVHYDWEYRDGKLTPGGRPGVPTWLVEMVGPEPFQEIRHVTIGAGPLVPGPRDQTRVNQEALVPLRELGGLRELTLGPGLASDD